MIIRPKKSVPCNPCLIATCAPAAFTLIELLTVIAIIGILAAIIIPTVGKVRQTARNATCVSNLRQIVNGALLYAADNKDRIPQRNIGGGDQWYWPVWLLGKQANLGEKGVMACPMQVAVNRKELSTPTGPVTWSYSVNWSFATKWTDASNPDDGTLDGKIWRFGDLQQPSRTTLYTEITAASYGFGTFTRTDGKDDFKYIHNSRQNFAFVDGHVAGFKKEGIPTVDTDAFWTGGLKK